MGNVRLLLLGFAALGALGFGLGGSPARAEADTPPAPSERTADSYLRWGEVFCPTADEEAWASYDEGYDHDRDARWDEAENAYRRAIDLDPGFCDAMDNLGLVLRRQGRLDEAIAWYQLSLLVAPTNPAARMNLAFAYSRQGKLAEALAEYQKLIELHPDDPEGHYGAGGIYLDMREPKDALPLLERAEELYAAQSSPYLSHARYSLGFALYLLGDWGGARAYLEQVYPEMVDHPPINFYLGICCLAMEDAEAAKGYLGRAKSLGVQLPVPIAEALGL